MSHEQPNNPLHGLTLKHIVTTLVQRHGFEALHRQVPINCFKSDPSINSTLKFLRKTPWARAKVEAVYLNDLRRQEAIDGREARAAARAAARSEEP